MAAVTQPRPRIQDDAGGINLPIDPAIQMKILKRNNAALQQQVAEYEAAIETLVTVLATKGVSLDEIFSEVDLTHAEAPAPSSSLPNPLVDGMPRP
jgi:hypothetical protein